MNETQSASQSTTMAADRPQRLVYINGKYVPEDQAGISIFDSALMFGDMVFEMTRSFNHVQFKLREHLARLYAGIRVLRIPLQLTIDELEGLVHEVVEHNRPALDDRDEERVMVNVSRGPLSIYRPVFDGYTGPTVAISVCPLSWTLGCSPDLYETGVHAVTPAQQAIPAHLLDPKIKNRSRLHYMMANLQVSLIHDPAAWALLLDPDGYVTEGTGSNFFIVTGGELLTPEPRNILRGITRRHTMDLALQMGIPVRECNIELYDVINADEAFFTSTPFTLMPCNRINDIDIGDGTIGPVTQTLMEAWSEDRGMDVFAQAKELVKLAPAMVGEGPHTYRFVSDNEPDPE
jgi:branched-chain amino acid aminotransferase